jgi:hypothetical protein
VHSPQLRGQMEWRRFFALRDSLSHTVLSRCATRLSGTSCCLPTCLAHYHKTYGPRSTRFTDASGFAV